MPCGSPWFGAGTYVASPSFPIISRAGTHLAKIKACICTGHQEKRLPGLPAAGANFLAERRSVLQAALGPELVQAAGDLEWALLADVTLEHLAIVADAGDHFHDPVVFEAEHRANLGFRLLAEDALDLRIVGALHFLDVGLGDAEFLGLDQRKESPLDDV